MTGMPLVLDAAGLEALAADRPPDILRALLAEAHRRGRTVIAPTLVCAELARGRARTRALRRRWPATTAHGASGRSCA